jgi:DnaJ like chaperone protein
MWYVVIGFAAWLAYILINGERVIERREELADQRRAARDEWDGEDEAEFSESNDDPEPVGPKPWHEVLGVSTKASMQDIKTAYRRLITQYHPDRVEGLGPELRELATVRAQEINAAYQAAIRAR